MSGSLPQYGDIKSTLGCFWGWKQLPGIWRQGGHQGCSAGHILIILFHSLFAQACADIACRTVCRKQNEKWDMHGKMYCKCDIHKPWTATQNQRTTSREKEKKKKHEFRVGKDLKQTWDHESLVPSHQHEIFSISTRSPKKELQC